MKRAQKHPTLWDWGRRRGKPWHDDDEICARFLRHCGLTDEAIGQAIGRSTTSIAGKIGYQRLLRKTA